jgi:hypothetical protein
MYKGTWNSLTTGDLDRLLAEYDALEAGRAASGEAGQVQAPAGTPGPALGPVVEIIPRGRQTADELCKEFNLQARQDENERLWPGK